MPISKSKIINLLPDDQFQSSTLGRILKWALSSFRVMVIITELVVMSAFLSRFWLDARNSDLNEELNVNKAQVLAYSNTEKEFRTYQKKLTILKSLYNEEKNSSLLSSISSVTPSDLVLSTIQRTKEGLQIKALSYTEQSIAQFLVNLSQIGQLSDIAISQVASSVDNDAITTFTITAKINSGGTR